MSENLLTEPISRREMMKRTAIAAGALALLPSLSACEGDMNVATLSKNIRRASYVAANDQEALMLELVRQSSLAASGHNMQPWMYEIERNNIYILPDFSRRLPVVDPDDRELWISLGCALENLIIAGRAMGFAVKESIQFVGDERLTVSIGELDEVLDADLASAISKRQCNRGAYNMKFVPEEDMEILQAVNVPSSAKTFFVRDGDEVKALRSMVMEGDVLQYTDEAFVNELVESLRFNEREALETRDGLFSACSGNPKVPRFLGKMFVKPGMGESQAEKDRQMIDTSSGLLLISTEGDSKLDWISAGRVVQRMALQMTDMGIAHAFMNQPIEVTALREEVKTYLSGKGSGSDVPQLLLRYGYADEAMPYSLRRAVDAVVR
jgi:hypothetical protein